MHSKLYPLFEISIISYTLKSIISNSLYFNVIDLFMKMCCNLLAVVNSLSSVPILKTCRIKLLLTEYKMFFIETIA